MRRIEDKDMHVYLKHEHGVTLIELLVIVALIGIMGIISTFGFDFINRQRLSSATTKLVADIQRVRVDAVTSSQTTTTGMGYGIRFTPPTSYTLFTWNDSNENYQYDGAGEEGNAETNTLFSKLELNVLNPPGDPTFLVLIYNKSGLPMRYKSGFPAIAGNMVLTLSEASTNIVRCVNVGTNMMWEGVISGTTCTQM